MIQNRQCRALALDARNVVVSTKSGEKIHHGSQGVSFIEPTGQIIRTRTNYIYTIEGM